MDKETCKSCGSSSFEIKSEHGVTYQHCAYCGRDTVIEQEPSNNDGLVIDKVVSMRMYATGGRGNKEIGNTILFEAKDKDLVEEQPLGELIARWENSEPNPEIETKKRKWKQALENFVCKIK